MLLNFINFLKGESERWISKLSDISCNDNIIYNNCTLCDNCNINTNDQENLIDFSFTQFQFNKLEKNKNENYQENKQINKNKKLIINTNLFPIIGIKNINNICNAIAGIQVLLHIKFFVNKFIKKVNTKNLDNSIA